MKSLCIFQNFFQVIVLNAPETGRIYIVTSISIVICFCTLFKTIMHQIKQLNEIITPQQESNMKYTWKNNARNENVLIKNTMCDRLFIKFNNSFGLFYAMQSSVWSTCKACTKTVSKNIIPSKRRTWNKKTTTNRYFLFLLFHAAIANDNF